MSHIDMQHTQPPSEIKEETSKYHTRYALWLNFGGCRWPIVYTIKSFAAYRTTQHVCALPLFIWAAVSFSKSGYEIRSLEESKGKRKSLLASFQPRF